MRLRRPNCQKPRGKSWLNAALYKRCVMPQDLTEIYQDVWEWWAPWIRVMRG